MVCNRCIRVVKEDLEKEGLTVESIELGKVSVQGVLNKTELAHIASLLQESGFELMGDKQSKIIESIKRYVIEHIHHQKDKPDSQNFSDYLAKKTGINYFNLSKLFSSTEGITLNKYIILQKIERVKELMVYDEKNLSEIAYLLEYSSVAHLSAQFKKETGLSPTAFKKLLAPRRQSLDEI